MSIEQINEEEVRAIYDDICSIYERTMYHNFMDLVIEKYTLSQITLVCERYLITHTCIKVRYITCYCYNKPNDGWSAGWSNVSPHKVKRDKIRDIYEAFKSKPEYILK